MKKTEITTIIGKSSYFSGLNKEECAKLAGFATVEELRKRQVLFMEGTTGNKIYLLVKGAVTLRKATPDGNEVVIMTIKPGAIFGEVILFEEDRYPVTATALAASAVLSFSRSDLTHLLDSRRFRNDFIAGLMKKQRYLAERVRYLGSYDAEERFLLFLKEQYGREHRIAPHLPKKDIASAIGTKPETFSRLINRMTKQGLINWEGKNLTVTDEAWKWIEGL